MTPPAGLLGHGAGTCPWWTGSTFAYGECRADIPSFPSARGVAPKRARTHLKATRAYGTADALSTCLISGLCPTGYCRRGTPAQRCQRPIAAHGRVALIAWKQQRTWFDDRHKALWEVWALVWRAQPWGMKQCPTRPVPKWIRGPTGQFLPYRDGCSLQGRHGGFLEGLVPRHIAWPAGETWWVSPPHVDRSDVGDLSCHTPGGRISRRRQERPPGRLGPGPGIRVLRRGTPYRAPPTWPIFALCGGVNHSPSRNHAVFQVAKIASPAIAPRAWEKTGAPFVLVP